MWRLYGRSICVLDRTWAPSGKLIRYDPANTSTQETAFEIGPLFAGAPGFDVAPDGRRLLYVRAHSIQFMMIDNFR